MLTTICGIGALVLIWLLYPKPFDYPGAVNDSLTFMQVCSLYCCALCLKSS